MYLLYFRLTIQCRYPANDTSALALHHSINSPKTHADKRKTQVCING